MTITTLAPFLRTARLHRTSGYTQAGTVLVRASETGGAFSIAMVVIENGSEPPPHMHHREHEGMFILEGELTVHVGRRKLSARAGDFVFLPRGVAHTFTVETDAVRMLVIMTPGGIEDYLAESHWCPMTSDAYTTAAKYAPSTAVIMAAKYDIEYVPSTAVIPDAGALLPFVRIPAVENTRLYSDRVLTTFYVNSNETGRAFAVVKSHGRKGSEPMQHIHHHEAECLFVLTGQITATVGKERYVAAAGTLMYLPQGVPHSFTADTDESAFLNVIVPGGFEGCFYELSTPVTSLTLPPAPNRPPHIERIMAVAAKYSIEYVFSHD